MFAFLLAWNRIKHNFRLRSRHRTTQNDIKAFRVLIVKGKYFFPPPEEDLDFKELFLLAVREGAGRPVDAHGFPSGPWSPELLAEAISQVHISGKGVDLRTVQRWFKNNDQGIRAENIRWLARVFGCGDPDASGKWQIALSAAQARLAEKRREQQIRKDDLPDRDVSPMNDEDPRLSKYSTALFTSAPLNLPAGLWAAWSGLGILAFILNIYSVTYSPVPGLDKQVGFFWAPNWTLLVVLLLPLFLTILNELLTFWINDGRTKLGSVEDDQGWVRIVASFSPVFWAVIFICFGIVFLLQWGGVYFVAFMKGDPGHLMKDWNFITLIRPEVTARGPAIVFSMLAFLLTAVESFLFLSGLVFLYIVATDFGRLCNSPGFQTCDHGQIRALELGSYIMAGIFRCVVVGLLMIMCIKLQATYLLSDGENIFVWLLNDALACFGLRPDTNGWLGQRALADFTSFVLLFLTCAVFLACFLKLYRILEIQLPMDAAHKYNGNIQISAQNHRTNIPWWMMFSVVCLGAVNCLLIGQFTGFSILLAFGIVAALYSLYDPMFGRSSIL